MLMLLAAATLCGCGGNTYQITGTLEPGITDSVFLMSQEDRENPEIASAVVAPDGTFTFQGTAEQAEIGVLANSNREGLSVVFIEPGKIKITTTPMGKIQVSGTKSNDALLPITDSLDLFQGQFMTAIQENDMAKVDSLDTVAKNLMNRAIENNLDNLAGVYLFSNLSVGMEPAQVKDLLSRFDKKLEQNPMLVSVRETLDAQVNTEIGKPYMEISLLSTTGETVALSSLVGPGKWVLIDFWATWCGPCREELPYLKTAFEEFAPKGFTIYGVSLDNDSEAWKTFITEQGMSWPNTIAVENGKSNPIVEEYGIRSIPSNFLISPEGKIVAKQLRGAELKTKLTELIK